MLDLFGVFGPDHALAQQAIQREWQYAERNDVLAYRFKPALGHAGETRDVITGTQDGRPFVAFRHVYADHRARAGGLGDHHHGPRWDSQAVVGLNLGARVPTLSVTPKGLLDGLFARDLQIGVPTFDAGYTVSTGTPEFAMDVLCSAVVEVMTVERRSWHFLDDTLLVIADTKPSLPFIDGALHAMDAVLDRIPEHVWARLLGEPPR